MEGSLFEMDVWQRAAEVRSIAGADRSDQRVVMPGSAGPGLAVTKKL
jgi:hypothetical protein